VLLARRDEGVHRDRRPTALAFLERYPTPVDARYLDEQRLAAFLQRHGYSGGRKPREMLARLRGAAHGHVGYGDPGFSRYIRRAVLAGAGYDADDLSRSLIGITDLTSDYNPCHALMPRLIDAVKRGVLEAGGVPFVVPTMSLGELLVSPTTMLYRNFLAMETEELVRAQPMGAVVMLGGWDKTIPAQLMAAASLEVPAILETVGPALPGALARSTTRRVYRLPAHVGRASRRPP
jgi:dihydroxyacid dehydratase/phosphogluconate dehydratase